MSENFEQKNSAFKISKLAEKNLAGILSILLVCAFFYPQLQGIISAKADVDTASESAITVDAVQKNSEQQPVPPAPAPVQIISVQDANPDVQPPKIYAKETLVFDATSNKNLFTDNPDQQVQIASLTKLMTAIVAIKNPEFNQPITITAADQLDVEPALHLQVGDRVLPADLLKAMLVGSANDAALALANHFPDYQDFIAAMNTEAQILGMSNTHYSTSIGFDDPQNYSTASDLKILVNYALKALPYQQVWQDSRDYQFTSLNGRIYKVSNSNFLVATHPNIKSIKTGLTPAAQGNMIVLASNPSGDKIISIVLNSAERESDTLRVIDYVFQKFSWNS